MTTGHQVVAIFPLAASTSRKVMDGGASGAGGRDDRQRGAHELGPDRKRGLRAGEAEHVSLVEPDPDERDQPGRVADKPRVPALVRRSRLPGDGALHAEPSRRCAGAAVHDPPEQVGDQEGLVGPQRPALARGAVRSPRPRGPPPHEARSAGFGPRRSRARHTPRPARSASPRSSPGRAPAPPPSGS